MSRFRDQMREQQVTWRRSHLPNQERGKQNGEFYDHVLPTKLWELNLWEGIGTGELSLPAYLNQHDVR
jgi:hypothetical protein